MLFHPGASPPLLVPLLHPFPFPSPAPPHPHPKDTQAEPSATPPIPTPPPRHPPRPHAPFARPRRAGLLAFSASAPAAALAFRYLLSGLLPGITQHPQAVALAVLFSGGTFVYASTVHVLPGALLLAGGLSAAATEEDEGAEARGHGHGQPHFHSHGHGHGHAHQAGPPGTRSALALLVSGALLPVAISLLVPDMGG